ncbi:hypothetical protein [Nonomuraea diastatica]|uniref:hypothetical protein n=1 Tax=Nonomuraea diastatica TaxID=1848329 RepID=UPI0014077622|nr:hypothetical protein [Nonomuraea diastatica]
MDYTPDNIVLRGGAEERGGGWARMWDEGIGDEIKRREAWLDRPWRAVIETVLSAP